MIDIDMSPELHEFLFGWQERLVMPPSCIQGELASADPLGPCPCGSGEPFPNCHGRDE